MTSPPYTRIWGDAATKASNGHPPHRRSHIDLHWYKLLASATVSPLGPPLSPDLSSLSKTKSCSPRCFSSPPIPEIFFRRVASLPSDWEIETCDRDIVEMDREMEKKLVLQFFDFTVLRSWDSVASRSFRFHCKKKKVFSANSFGPLIAQTLGS